jgi:hypothetical protein
VLDQLEIRTHAPRSTGTPRLYASITESRRSRIRASLATTLARRSRAPTDPSQTGTDETNARISRDARDEAPTLRSFAGDDEVRLFERREGVDDVLDSLDRFQTSHEEEIRTASRRCRELRRRSWITHETGSTSMSREKPNSWCLSRLKPLIAMNAST